GTRRKSTSPTARIRASCRWSASCPESRGSGSAISRTRTWCATAWCVTSSAPTRRTHRADMRLPTQGQARYHGSRWFWVVGLAVLAYLAFPSSATNVAPMTVGKPANRDVVAPFTFPVNKSDEELAREAEELAGTVKPIYQFQERAADSAKIAMHALFSSLESAADQGGAVAIQQAAKAQGLALSLPEAAYLNEGGKRHGLERALSELFERTLALGVTGPGVLQVEQAPELIVRRRTGEQAVARDQVLSYAQYLQRARAVHPDRSSSVGDELYVRLDGHFFRPTMVPHTRRPERPPAVRCALDD